MPTRKIADLPRPCLDPQHNPPSHCVFSEGIYEHECPSCGQRQQFCVRLPRLLVVPPRKTMSWRDQIPVGCAPRWNGRTGSRVRAVTP